MPRSILIRIHMSRIIVYLDRDLNIFQASCGAAGPEARCRIPAWQIEMDSISFVRNNEEWGNGPRSVLMCVTMGDQTRSRGGGKKVGGGKDSSMRMWDLQTYAEPRGVPNCLHRESVFTIHEISKWFFLLELLQGQRYSMFSIAACALRTQDSSVPTEFTQARVMSDQNELQKSLSAICLQLR